VARLDKHGVGSGGCSSRTMSTGIIFTRGFDVVRASWPPDLRSNEQAA
jgi:hypothetical protein